MNIDDEKGSIRIQPQFQQLQKSQEEGLLRRKKNTSTHNPIFGRRKC